MNTIDSSMFELFREEVKSHADTLTSGLIAIEANPTDRTRIEPLMRAAHSIKGAARIVGINTAVRLAHVMEDALVAAQNGVIRISPSDIDILLKGADLLAGLAVLTPDTIPAWEANTAGVGELESRFVAMAKGESLGPTSSTLSLQGGGERGAGELATVRERVKLQHFLAYAQSSPETHSPP